MSDLPSVVLADPPWPYGFSKSRSRRVENHYPTMGIEEICGYQFPRAADGVLYLWATAPKLLEALRVMDAWGYAYRTSAAWDKEKVGMGYWFRGQHELLLVGTRGHFSPPHPSRRAPSVFRSPRREHSAKPECVHEMIEAAFPDAVKLELFARTRRPGWLAMGLEVERAGLQQEGEER